MTITLDLDEVLADSMRQEAAWFNSINQEQLSLEQYALGYWNFWNIGDKAELIKKMIDYNNSEFPQLVKPVKGAVQGVEHLSKLDRLVVVTGRSAELRKPSERWLDRYFPGKIAEVYFANVFELEGKEIPKSVLCKQAGSKLHVDDSPTYSRECSENGIKKVLLFDHVRNKHVKLSNNMERAYGWLGQDKEEGVLELVERYFG